MPLHKFAREEVQLLRWQSGIQVKTSTDSGGKEIYVISGSFSDDLANYTAGTWIRYPANQQHTLFSHQGCTLYQKTEHLPAANIEAE